MWYTDAMEMEEANYICGQWPRHMGTISVSSQWDFAIDAGYES